MVPVEACEPYFKYMRRSVDLDADMMQLVSDHISEINYPAKHIFLQQGAVCNKVHFIVSGTARSYYIDSSGLTVTWSFLFNNESSIGRNLFALDYRAYLTNKPSSIAIETMSEVRAFIFPKEELNQMIEKCAKYERFMRKLSESAYVYMYDRAFTLLTMSATERYHKLLAEEPHLMQMFSNYYIASYLGIAPQSLSRIRTQHRP
jgi:CRP-like cAMP-binding protein